MHHSKYLIKPWELEDLKGCHATLECVVEETARLLFVSDEKNKCQCSVLEICF